MRASRNDPCPCGSGKKYKRCCLDKDEASAPAPAAPPPAEPELTEEELALEDELDRDADLAAAVDRPFDEDEAPWELARLAESHPTFAEARARDPAWVAMPALPSEVERLTVHEVRARLAALGVDASPDAFLAAAREALAQGRPSGWAIAATWRARLRPLTRPERDFLGIAACDLWRRHLPAEPSKEMLEDAIAEGHALLDEDRREEAFAAWRKVLRVVLARVPAGALTLAEAPAAGDALVLGEWLEGWLDELHALAPDDPAAALEGLRLTEEVLARLPEQGGPSGGTTRAAHAIFLLATGRDAEGLAEARRLRDAHPDLAVGYVALAEALAFDAERDPARLAEAVDVLWRAKQRPVSDAAPWKLDERHREMRRLLRRAEAGS